MFHVDVLIDLPNIIVGSCNFQPSIRPDIFFSPYNIETWLVGVCFGLAALIHISSFCAVVMEWHDRRADKAIEIGPLYTQREEKASV